MRPVSSFTKAGAPRYCSGSCESHFSSGYCIVTLVRRKSISLKCRRVIAIPATIVGKYNRSDQVSFGRGTVIAINTHLFDFSFLVPFPLPLFLPFLLFPHSTQAKLRLSGTPGYPIT